MTTVHPQRVGFSVQRLARVDRLLDRYVKSGYLAGVLGLIYRKGEIAYCNASGRRERETGRPMTEDTIFRIYSMTKPITAVAALMLFEEGHFLLDDPLARYLPEFADVQVCAGGRSDGLLLAPPERPISIKDMFMHTGGLSYGWHKDSPVETLYRQTVGNRESVPLQTVVQKLATLPLLYQPGARWRYSLATDVLGRLVEVLSGKTLDEFFQQEIFKPLGMTETGFHVPAESLDRFAACYCPLGGFTFDQDLARHARTMTRLFADADQASAPADAKIELQEAPQTSRFAKPPIFLSGGGGLVSTVGDYLRFAQMLLNGGALDGNRLLGRKTVELMRTNHLPAELIPIHIGGVFQSGYGFGLGVSVLVDAPASGALGSSGIYGWSGAATTQFWIDPQEEMLGICMAQFIPSGYYPITREFRVAAYQALVA